MRYHFFTILHFLFFLTFFQNALSAFPGIPAPPLDSIVRLKWVNFSPYTKPGQNPNNGTVMPPEQITALLDSLRPWAEGIRTFGTQNGLEHIPRLAKERGFKVIVGIWLGKDTLVNAQQVANGIAIAKAGYADRIIVGSEVLLRNDLPVARLVQYIQQVKQACPNIPVSCADVYYKLAAAPTVIAACDFVAPNIYPYFEGAYIDCAMGRFHQAYLSLLPAAAGKEILISESGWKTKLPAVGNAIPSFENAVRYNLELLRWSKTLGVDVCIFEAFDEPWKGPDDGWGIFFNDATMKPGMEVLFQPHPPLDIALFCKMPTPLGGDTIHVNDWPVMGSYSKIKGRVNFYNPCDYKIVMYIKVPNSGWWIKPTFDQPSIPIDCKGNWESAYATGGNDAAATEICLFLVPKDYNPVKCAGCAALPTDIYQKAVARKCFSRYLLSAAAISAEKDTVCWGDSIFLTATGGNIYYWNTGDTTAQLQTLAQSTNIYMLTVSNGMGGGAILQKRITVLNFFPSVAITPLPVCRGDSATLNATGGIEYKWSSGETGPLLKVAPPKDSIYIVTVTSAASCTKTVSATVRVSNPKAGIFANDPEICNGETVNLYATGGSYFLWSTGQTSSYIQVAPLETSHYKVTVTTTTGCMDSASITIKVLDRPAAFALAQPDTVCRGESVRFVSGGGATYRWNNGKTDSTFNHVSDYSRSFTVTVTSTLGCTQTATASVTVLNVPNATVYPAAVAVCIGKSVTLNTSGGSINTYKWNTGQTAASIQVAPAATTTYTLTVTNKMGCTNVGSSTVTVLELPTPLITATKTNLCLGDTAILVASGGLTYLWSTAETTASIKVAPGILTTYTVRATNAAGCTQTTAVVIRILDCTSAINYTGPIPYFRCYVAPNPFRDKLTLNVELPLATTLKASLLDGLGRRVATFGARQVDEGPTVFEWELFKPLPPGIYTLVLQAGYYIQTQKVLKL